METVMILSQVDDENCDTSDKVLQYQVADVLMFFLPGLASALEEIAISNEIQGHLITVVIKTNVSLLFFIHFKALNQK